MFFFTLFRLAGATGYVFLLRNGKSRPYGLAWSGIIGPSTTVAVVPTTPRVISFSIETRTSDNQSVTVVGDLKITLDPAVAATKFDFTVDPKNGAYKNAWSQDLQAGVMAQVLAPVRDNMRGLLIKDAMTAHAGVMKAVMDALSGESNPLSAFGIKTESCSIVRIEADDEEVANSIGATERQLMLTNADLATHTRQIAKATNARAVSTYEAETKLELERKRTDLIAQQSTNKQAEAVADAEATTTRLAPMMTVDPGRLLAMSIMEMAKTGRVGNLNISPEIFAAVSAASSKAA